MGATFANVLPLFALMVCGYGVGRTPLISAEGLRGLNTFVFYLAIPALVMRTLALQPLPSRADLGIAAAYGAAALVVWGAFFLLGRGAFRHALDEGAMLATAATQGNVVMLGVPVVLAGFGEAALPVLMLVVTFQMGVLFPLATALAELDRARGGSRRPGPLLRGTVGALGHNPVILSLAAGFGWALTGLPLPGPLDTFLRLLAAAASPCALFALGATLSSYRLAGDLAESLAVVTCKLLVLPLVIWLVVTRVVPIDPLRAAVVVVGAAMPTGVNSFVLARHYDAAVNRVASAVLLSALLSLFTLTLLLALLHAG